jgi:hypothetical protein
MDGHKTDHLRLSWLTHSNNLMADHGNLHGDQRNFLLTFYAVTYMSNESLL